MLQPPYLQSGDSVIIVSTARKISQDELTPAVKLMESWGLKVNFGKNLFKEYHQFAGTAEERAEDLQAALDDKKNNAIICARGGYGTVQLIDQVDFTEFKESPKWIVGYSDVTVLHNHINQNFEIETLHATMPISFPVKGTDEATESLRKALFGEDLIYEFELEEESSFNSNSVTAQLVGGNLSILYSLTGTTTQINGESRFVFMEDLDEYLYHIDRMMMNLKRAGLFKSCVGVLVGGMSDMNDNNIPYGKTAKQIIVDNLKGLGIPVVFGVPSGHIKRNLALVMGRRMTLEKGTENKAKITFHGRT